MAEDYKIQLSVKIDGVHMLNVRSNDTADFGALLKWTVDNAVQLQAACAALEGERKAVPPPTTSEQAMSRPGATSGEIGPVGITGIEKQTQGRDGMRFKAPKYTVMFSNGKKFSTFNGTLAGAAQALSEVPVYYTTEQSRDGKYTNLASVRSAT